MLPDPDHQPTLFAKLRSSGEIARPIAEDFLAPVAHVGLGYVTVSTFGASMPEAAIDEDGNLRRSKDYVRLPRQRYVNAIPANSARRKSAPESDFRFSVRRANARHVERANG